MLVRSWTAFDETIKAFLTGSRRVRGTVIQNQGRGVGGQGYTGSVRLALSQSLTKSWSVRVPQSRSKYRVLVSCLDKLCIAPRSTADYSA